MGMFTAHLRELEQNYYVRMIEDGPELTEIYRLRHQVYCTERGFLPGDDGLETDEFDSHSRHIGLFHRPTDELVGTARLVLPKSDPKETSFPMQEVSAPELLANLPKRTTAEVSRFAISKQRRNDASSALMRLTLVQGLVTLSRELGVTHWCAVMEPTLLRLLRMTSIHFRPLGPVVDYHGWRQPCFNSLNSLLDLDKGDQQGVDSPITLTSTSWSARLASA